jgi:RNA recognition motif-containing protein
LIVRDFPYGTSEEQLRDLILPHAEVLNIEVPRHATGEPKDFALIDVADEAQAEDAVRHLHGSVYEGRRLRVKIATPHKVGEGAPLRPEAARPFAPEPQPRPLIERPERHFLRTTRTQRRV